MKLTLQTAPLRKALALASKVAERKNAMPIADCILFSYDGNDYTLTIYSEENTLRQRIEVIACDDYQPLALNLRTLSDLLGVMPDQPITIITDPTSNEVTLTHQSGHSTFTSSPAELFPAFPVVPQPTAAAPDHIALQLPFTLLANAVSSALPFTATDDLRPVMNGVCLHLLPSGLTVVASNGRSLTRHVFPELTTPTDQTILLSQKTASLLKALPAAEQITLTSNSRQFLISTPDFVLAARLIEGKFPNYNAVIPTSHTITIAIPRAELLAAVRRASVMSSRSTGLLIFDFNPSTPQVTLSGRDYDFSTGAQEKVTATTCPSTALRIGFKSDTLQTLLNTATTAHVTLQLSDASRCLLMTETEGDHNLTLLQVPLLINE